MHCPEFLVWYAYFYLVCAQGRHDEALAIAKKAVEIDPLSGYAHAMLGVVYSCSRKTEEAVWAARASVELEPSFVTYFCLHGVQDERREFDEAIAAAEMALALSGRHVWSLATLARTYAAMGKMAEARAVYAELLARAAHEYVLPVQLALAASTAGEADKAFGHLYEAVEIRDPALITVNYVPDTALLREDRRFDDILARMNWK